MCHHDLHVVIDIYSGCVRGERPSKLRHTEAGRAGNKKKRGTPIDISIQEPVSIIQQKIHLKL